MGVERKGRAFTRGMVRMKWRRRDHLAAAVDPNLPLLQRLQHEFATRALRPRLRSAAEVSRRFRLITRDLGPHADPGVLHKGFGSFRRPFARFLEGAILEPAGRGPNAAQPEL
jgi:hypothetical protein